MENASKALLIAGAVLLVMLIVGLLIFSWGKFKDFYSNNDEFAEIEDLSKFNLQFTNYQNRKVYGYELISLANKVADYNMRYSNIGSNDEKYTPITMSISLKGKADKFNFGEITTEGKRIESNKLTSFFNEYNNKDMIQSTTRNDITRIITEATGVEDFYSGSDKTAKLAKSINTLILTDSQIQYNKNNKNMTEEESKASAVENYKFIVKSDEKITYKQMVDRLTGNGGNILKYYEYIQFKKGIFKCKDITDNDYDESSGRIKLIQFEFTGNIE